MFVEKIPVSQVAFCLGQGDPLEARLLQQGLLKHTAPGLWEVLTREAQAQGEVARDGDFIKLDSIGMPYPVEAAFFLPRHTRQPDGRYLQTPRVLQAWRQEEPMGHEMLYLLETGNTDDDAIVTAQDIPPGTEAEPGTTICLTFTDPNARD